MVTSFPFCMAKISQRKKYDEFNKSLRPRREVWNGKYVAIIRVKGRIVTWQKWSKTNNLKFLDKLFKSTGTFKVQPENVERKVMKNVYEVIDYRENPKPKGRAQYIVEGTLSNGDKILGRSFIEDKPFPIKRMKEHAFMNFYGRLGNHFNNDGMYDSNVGEKFFEMLVSKGKISIREGFVYYVDKPQALQKKNF